MRRLEDGVELRRAEVRDGQAPRAARRLQVQAATVCIPGCNLMHPGLQPHASRAATVCIPGCNLMYPGLQPYVCRRLEVLEGSPLCADACIVLAWVVELGLGLGLGLGCARMHASSWPG